MTITAKIIADSVSPFGPRITTMQLRYPRFIHAEFMTHRAFSRNASSSRAIPVERLIQDVIDDPAMPSHWGKNQPGMQAREEHDAEVALAFASDDYVYGSAAEAWIAARDDMVERARCFASAGYHKQVVNRLLEPFAHINVVVTATDWDNFFVLRDHPDAQPEIQALAQAMRKAMLESRPAQVGLHLPYVSDGDYAEIRRRFGARAPLESSRTQAACEISAARCARVSYLTHDGKEPDLVADLALYQRLAGGVPFHASPLEHQARTAHGRHANLVGWKSFRTEQGL